MNAYPDLTHMHALEVRGVAVPAIGFGTWELHGDVARRSVETALEAGYRHIDTAQMYDNEADVGAAIRESRMVREVLGLIPTTAGSFEQRHSERAGKAFSVHANDVHATRKTSAVNRDLL